MTNLLATGAIWLAARMRESASSSVAYKRRLESGTIRSVTLNATPSNTSFETQRGDEEVVSLESRDFLITTADLILASVAALPERGDWIEETVGATTYKYEVLFLNGEPQYRFADPYRKQLRIHTKHIGNG